MGSRLLVLNLMDIFLRKPFELHSLEAFLVDAARGKTLEQSTITMDRIRLKPNLLKVYPAIHTRMG